MFAPNDFSAPTSPRPPIQHDRLIGALVLLIFIILCLVMTLGMDRVLFIPFNATRTWEAQHSTPGAQPTRPGARQQQTVTPPAAYDQQVQHLVDFS